MKRISFFFNDGAIKPFSRQPDCCNKAGQSATGYNYVVPGNQAWKLIKLKKDIVLNLAFKFEFEPLLNLVPFNFNPDPFTGRRIK